MLLYSCIARTPCQVLIMLSSTLHQLFLFLILLQSQTPVLHVYKMLIITERYNSWANYESPSAISYLLDQTSTDHRSSKTSSVCVSQTLLLFSSSIFNSNCHSYLSISCNILVHLLITGRGQHRLAVRDTSTFWYFKSLIGRTPPIRQYPDRLTSLLQWLIFS